MMTVIVAGVSGCGKTTVGELLAERLSQQRDCGVRTDVRAPRWQFIDGDSLHPEANVAKMARGEPLTDADRAPWLRRIGSRIDAEEAAGHRSVVACSALKRRYRAELLGGRPSARMAFLMIDYEVACERLKARRGHFFDASLLGSQFAALEPPAPDEDRVVSVPVRDQPEATVSDVLRALGLVASS
ncbi:MAG TPA: gluconokinase [Streptosporangiaceae bacterium]|nr:gluconokinase [Streptosporangiaceae bacterium]